MQVHDVGVVGQSRGGGDQTGGDQQADEQHQLRVTVEWPNHPPKHVCADWPHDRKVVPPAARKSQKRREDTHDRNKTQQHAARRDDAHLGHTEELAEGRTSEGRRRRDGAGNQSRPHIAEGSPHCFGEICALRFNDAQPCHDVQREVNTEPDEDGREDHREELQVADRDDDPSEAPCDADNERGRCHERQPNATKHADEHDGDQTEGDDRGDGGVAGGLVRFIRLDGRDAGHAPRDVAEAVLIHPLRRRAAKRRERIGDARDGTRCWI